MKKKESVPVLLRMPAQLARRLEKVATAEGRTRNAEACRRLADSFKAGKAGASA